MKRWWNRLLMWPLALSLGGWACARAQAAPESAAGDTVAIRAIQQAPTPSAVIDAFANGFAQNRNDPKFYAAYVARMVDLDLPTLAYHQAQTLTVLDPKSGLAWGVIAYADIQRPNMVAAISAINLAGKYAPCDPFVERTAGNIAAWYDVNPYKYQVPRDARLHFAEIRDVLANHMTFLVAYYTAKPNYQIQLNDNMLPG